MKQQSLKIIEGIELALSVIIPEAKGRWVPVKEISIAKTLKEAGVSSKDYASVLVACLSKKGLLFTEGTRGGMSYKFTSDVIPDLHFLALEIHKEVIERRKSFPSSSDGYPSSKASDLRPFKPKPVKEFYESGKPCTVKRRIVLPNLNDLVFVYYNDLIYQAVITGIKRVLDSEKRPQRAEYSVTFLVDDVLMTIDHLYPKDIFNSAEAVADFLVRRTKMLPKDFIRQFNS